MLELQSTPRPAPHPPPLPLPALNTLIILRDFKSGLKKPLDSQLGFSQLLHNYLTFTLIYKGLC